MNADGLELRVLSGLHRRASADRRAGHDRRRSGLRHRAGRRWHRARAARIHHDATGWTLTPEDGGARNGASRANPPGWARYADPGRHGRALDRAPRRMRRRSKTRPSSIRPATRRTPPTHPPAPPRRPGDGPGTRPAAPARAQEPRGAVRLRRHGGDAAALRVRHRLHHPAPADRPGGRRPDAPGHRGIAARHPAGASSRAWPSA